MSEQAKLVRAPQVQGNSYAASWTWILPSCMAIVSGGCAHYDAPIRTSLIDITGEARTTRIYTGGVNPFPIAEHRQAISIGGLLNIPDIGQEFQFSAQADVTTAVGIAVVQSYRLIGEAEAPDDRSHVTKVRDALEKVQQLAADASILTAEIARLRKEVSDASLKQDLERRLEKRGAVELELEKARADLRILANHPGIIIARWDVTSAQGANVQLGSALGVAGAETARRAGFVILGGLRVVSVVFGEDFWWLLNNLRPHEKDYIDQIGITTSMLQARDVAYTSDASVAQGLAIQGDLSKVGSVVEAVRIAGYWSFIGQYSNSGNLPRVVWKREPFCTVCSLDLPELAKPSERALQKWFGVETRDGDGPGFQGWRTISANITYLRDVPFFFGWKDHAANYADRRLMDTSPSCPVCQGRPTAVVEGRARTEEQTKALLKQEAK